MVKPFVKLLLITIVFVSTSYPVCSRHRILNIYNCGMFTTYFCMIKCKKALFHLPLFIRSGGNNMKRFLSVLLIITIVASLVRLKQRLYSNKKYPIPPYRPIRPLQHLRLRRSRNRTRQWICLTSSSIHMLKCNFRITLLYNMHLSTRVLRSLRVKTPSY